MLRMAMLTVVAGVAVSPMARMPFGSVRSSRNTGSLVTMECPLPLWFSAGATMWTSPMAWRICATAAMPGARTPSSLATRIRYGGGSGRCCATAPPRSAQPATTIAVTAKKARRIELERSLEVLLRPEAGFGRLRRGRLLRACPENRPAEEAEQRHREERDRERKQRANQPDHGGHRHERRRHDAEEQPEEAEDDFEEDAEREGEDPEDDVEQGADHGADDTDHHGRQHAGDADQEERAHRYSWLRRNPETGSATRRRAWSFREPRRARDCAALLPWPRART